jgi:hypothetical protein
MNLKTMQRHNRQQGMALILAIGFLAVLSILGAVVLNLATEGVKDSASVLPRRLSFYTADRAVEYAMNRDIIINMPVSGTVNLVTDDVKLANGTTLTGVKHKSIVEKDSVGTLTSGTVTDLGPRNLPPAMAAIHGSEFGANLYHVNVEASAPLGGTTHVDASIVRLFKLDDDQIFRTSGGG